MKTKSLASSNPFLKDATTARQRIIRSIASSTAIETSESIQAIEKNSTRKLLGIT